MNNEPVAWYWEEKQIVDLKRGSGKLDKVFGTPIPLYTHPAKTLTDEEIELCRELVINDDELNCYDDEIPSERFAIKFARAILKKASEK
jgi:hypothetical protein